MAGVGDKIAVMFRDRANIQCNIKTHKEVFLEFDITSNICYITFKDNIFPDIFFDSNKTYTKFRL